METVIAFGRFPIDFTHSVNKIVDKEGREITDKIGNLIVTGFKTFQEMYSKDHDAKS